MEVWASASAFANLAPRIQDVREPKHGHYDTCESNAVVMQDDTWRCNTLYGSSDEQLGRDYDYNYHKTDRLLYGTKYPL